jgi:hypothetical protein
MLKRCLVLAFAVMIFSCDQDPSEIGSDFFSDGALDFSTIDTATVSLSTILFENIQTNTSSRLLVGSHTDARLGKIKARSYFQVGKPSSLDFPNANLSYAYCAIALKYDGYSYYDTTQTITLKVHRLTESFELEDNQYLYNDSHFLYSASPLGERSFKPRPHKDDSLEIRLSDDFGVDLYNKALTKHEVMTQTDELLEFLKGFVIVPDVSDLGSIIGFNTAPELRIYYHDNNEVPSELKYISLPRSSSAFYFNQISSDWSETNLTLTSSKQRLKAEASDDESYVQSGIGLALRVDMPYLRDFARHENLFVMKAVLEIYPVRRSNDEHTKLPLQLKPYVVDKRNDIMGELLYNAPLEEDIDLNRTTHYELDVTDFVESQIATEALNENALVFITTAFNSAIDRLYIASKGYEYSTSLKIYYTTVNN